VRLRITAVALAAACCAVAGCGGPGAITVSGTLDDSSASGWTETAGQPCDYGDGTETQMELVNASGAVLATSALVRGTLQDPSDCVLHFRFTGVPATGREYGVRLPDHGTQWYTRSQVSGHLSLTVNTG